MPDTKKVNRGQSCMLCHQRKMRCDEEKPCTNCVRFQQECRVMPLAPPKPRRNKQALNRALLERLHQYEEMLTKHGVPLPKDRLPGLGRRRAGAEAPQDAPVVATDSITLSEGGDEAGNGSPNGGSGASNNGDGSGRGGSGSGGGSDSSSHPVRWVAYNKEYERADGLLGGLSDDDDEADDQPAFHRDFDAVFDDADGFPFIIDGHGKNLASLHPSTIDILQLWQVYIQRVDPLLKVGHLPTMQAQIISTSANRAVLDKPLEALMFAMYLIAVHSLSDSEAQDMFHEAKSSLIGRYQYAAQHALVKAAFMRSSDMTVLQAFLLYLHGISGTVDPRSLFCLVGMAVRIARRMGLNRDCAGRDGVSPFNVEMRRRLWWQIALLDTRLAEMTGSPVSALTQVTDTHPPLNVNDLALHPSARTRPLAAVGCSEMLFVLARIDLTLAWKSMSDHYSMTHHAPPASITVRDSTSSGPAGSRSSREAAGKAGRGGVESGEDPGQGGGPPPVTGSQQTSPERNYNPARELQNLKDHLKSTYLQYCDASVPIHIFTRLMTRSSICQMKLISFLKSNLGLSGLSRRQREDLFMDAIEMIDCDTKIHTTECLAGFRWYANLHVPMLACIFAASELRYLTRGDVWDNGWRTLAMNYELRNACAKPAGSPADKRRGGPMRAAFERMLLAAWDAAERPDIIAEKERPEQSLASQHDHTPELIRQLRAARAAASSDPPAPSQACGECFRETNFASNEDSSAEPWMCNLDGMMLDQLTPMSLPTLGAEPLQNLGTNAWLPATQELMESWV